MYKLSVCVCVYVTYKISGFCMYIFSKPDICGNIHDNSHVCKQDKLKNLGLFLTLEFAFKTSIKLLAIWFTLT